MWCDLIVSCTSLYRHRNIAFLRGILDTNTERCKTPIYAYHTKTSMLVCPLLLLSPRLCKSRPNRIRDSCPADAASGDDMLLHASIGALTPTSSSLYEKYAQPMPSPRYSASCGAVFFLNVMMVPNCLSPYESWVHPQCDTGTSC